MADLKSLKIKTGICKRVMKEMQSYEAEAEREFAKVENMKKNHADPSDIKQQVALEINSQTIIIWLWSFQYFSPTYPVTHNKDHLQHSFLYR